MQVIEFFFVLTVEVEDNFINRWGFFLLFSFFSYTVSMRSSHVTSHTAFSPVLTSTSAERNSCLIGQYVIFY